MPKLATVLGVGDNNNVILDAKERLVQRLAGLPTNQRLSAGQSIDFELAETASLNSADLVKKIDSALSSMESTVTQLESIKAQLNTASP